MDALCAEFMGSFFFILRELKHSVVGKAPTEFAVRNMNNAGGVEWGGGSTLSAPTKDYRHNSLTSLSNSSVTTENRPQIHETKNYEKSRAVHGF